MAMISVDLWTKCTFCWFLFPSYRMTVDGPWWRAAEPTTSNWSSWHWMVVMPSCWAWRRYSPRTHPLGHSVHVFTVSHCSTFSLHPFSVYTCEWCDNGFCPHHFLPLRVHIHTSLCAVCSCVRVSPSPVQIHVMIPSCVFMQHVMLHSALYVQREPFCVPSLNVCIVFGMLCATCMVCRWCSMMMTSLSFTAGKEPLPDDVACAIGTCMAAMKQLGRLLMFDFSQHAMKTLADRTQPLDRRTSLWIG